MVRQMIDSSSLIFALYIAIVIEIEKDWHSSRTVKVLDPVKILMAVTNSIGLYS